MSEPRFQVIEAKVWHCGLMARSLRSGHLDCIARTGLNTHRKLRAAFDASLHCRSWLIDGRLSAMGGITGSMAGSSGGIWFALTDEATRHPLALLKMARAQFLEIPSTKRELHSIVLHGDAAAMRFARHLGFSPVSICEAGTVVSRRF